jgi:F0F1-type ATP synthase assembly protein I
MQLPNELQVILAAAIAFLITQGLKSISERFGLDLSGSAAVLTASAVTFVTVFANSLLAFIPPEAQPIISAIFGLLVALFGAFGLHRTLSKK